MDQIFARSVIESFSLAGGNQQSQDSFQLTPGKLIAALRFHITATFTTTTGTVHPHPADLLNILKRLEVYTGGAKTYYNLSGMDIHAKWLKRKGVSHDNKALVGAVAATAATARLTVDVPFTLPMAKQPYDGLLETFQKKVYCKLSYNDLMADGTLFGDTTGLSDVQVNITVSTLEYRCSTARQQYLLANTVQPIIQTFDFPIAQTNDAFVIKNLPENAAFFAAQLMQRATVNGNIAPVDDIIDADKTMRVLSTLDNNTYQEDLVRNLRGETLQRYQDASLVDGLIDVPMTLDGSLLQSIASTAADELRMELPVVANGTGPSVRVLTETWINTAKANA